MKAAFATRIAGSADLYAAAAHGKRVPSHSVNFVVAHDGFSLYDLVAYNAKHNEVIAVVVAVWWLLGDIAEWRATGDTRRAF